MIIELNDVELRTVMQCLQQGSWIQVNPILMKLSNQRMLEEEQKKKVEEKTDGE